MVNYERITWENQPITAEKMQNITDAICDIESKINNKMFLVHNCQNCGATLEIEENKPLFHCKYCGSAYVIGASRIYSEY
ncbi:MAG: hypothetical protein J5725_00495 [Bacteroidales bacterium]|nr:hypothetical protein [Bacteroidales bacterium]